MQTDDYSATEVLVLLGIPFSNKKNTRLTCPVCGKNNFYMRIDGERNVGKCWSCNFFCNHTQLYAEMYHLSAKDADREIRERLNIGNNSPKEMRKPIAENVTVKELPIASIETRDIIYRSMIKNLSGRHLQDMGKRGLTKEEATSLGYISYNNQECRQMASSIIRKGLNLKGVPGFFVDTKTQEWTTIWLKNGILVPYLDEHRRIQGFQLRKNNEELTKKPDGKYEEKCNWFSSASKNQGCGCKAWYHMACDFYYDFSSNQYYPLIGDTLYLTEGAMKGDIIHLIDKKPVIAIPGVSAIAELKRLFTSGFLQKIGVKRIIDVCDMDYLTNSNVFNAVERLKALITEFFDYERKEWEIHVQGHCLKGYDDFLAYARQNI